MTNIRNVRSSSSTSPIQPSATPTVTTEKPAPAKVDQREALNRAQADQAKKTTEKFVNAPRETGGVSPLNARLQVAALDGKGTVATDSTTGSVTGVHGSLAGNALLIGTPSALGKPAPETTRSVTHTVGAHGFSGSVTTSVGTDAQGRYSDAVGLDVSRASGTIDLSRTRDGHMVDGAIYVDPTCIDLGGLVKSTTTKDVVQRLGGDLGIGRGYVFVAATGMIHAPGMNTYKGSAIAVASADRAVADLGVDEKTGGRRIQFTKSVSGSLAGALGEKLPTFGIGGRLTVRKGSDVTFTTSLEKDKAKAVLTEGGGVISYLRNKARAVGMAAEPVVVPDLADPSTMKVGDALTIKTAGSVTGGVALGYARTTVGIQATMTGEFELSAVKLDENRIELGVSPTSLRGMQVFADTGYFLDVGHTHAKGEGFRQSFIFDLSKPGAAEAYQRALKGDLPNGLDSKDVPGDADALAALVRDEKLPAGVSRTVLERADVEASTTGGGLNWGLVQSNGGIAGLSLLRTKTEGRTVVTSGDAALVTENRGVERRREVLLSGTEIDGVSASARTVTIYDAKGVGTRAFDTLKLTAHFSDDRVKGLELNDEVLDRINNACGTSLPHFERAGHKQSRSVVVEQVLADKDLEKLAGASASDAREVAALAGVKDKRVSELITALKGSRDVETRAGIVKDFVAREGLNGFGVVHRLLGSELAVHTDSNAYSKPVTTAETLALKYETNISSTDNAETITVRFKEVLPVLKDVKEAQLDVKDDKLLTVDERTNITGQLDGAEKTLGNIISVAGLSPSERSRIRAEIEGGWWTTSTEAVVLKSLGDVA